MSRGEVVIVVNVLESEVDVAIKGEVEIEIENDVVVLLVVMVADVDSELVVLTRDVEVVELLVVCAELEVRLRLLEVGEVVGTIEPSVLLELVMMTKLLVDCAKLVVRTTVLENIMVDDDVELVVLDVETAVLEVLLS